MHASRAVRLSIAVFFLVFGVVLNRAAPVEIASEILPRRSDRFFEMFSLSFNGGGRGGGAGTLAAAVVAAADGGSVGGSRMEVVFGATTFSDILWFDTIALPGSALGDASTGGGRGRLSKSNVGSLGA